MKPKSRILSLLLAICLVVGLMPTAALAAGTDTGKAIQLVDSGTAANIDGYDSTDGYDYIYYGTWNDSAIKWRVLDDQTNTGENGLFLLSEELLGTGNYGGVYFQQSYHYDSSSGSYHKGSAPANGDHTDCLIANAWQGSDAQTWCATFYSSNFSTGEQSAVLGTTKSDGAFTSSTYNVPFAASESILNGDKVFFLSAQEAENSAYGFTDDAARIANYGGSAGVWWLRSPYAYNTYIAGVVDCNGYVGTYHVYTDWAARPAFNLDLNSVLFTSAAAGGKSASGMDSGLTAVDDYTGSEWKLTLLDETREFAVTEQTASGKPGDTITLNYTGATTGENEYISVIIADENGAQYYGRVAQPGGESGTATLSIPADLAPGSYTLNVFSEQYNGDYKTDYASAFAEVALTVEEAAAPGIDTGKAIQLVDSGTAANIGGGQADNIYFGTYQQSSDGSVDYNTDPIKWRVLENADGQLFLLSDQNLDVFQYHVDYESVTWATSTMRSWLNGYGASHNTGDSGGIDYTDDNFINTAFSEKEQKAIADTTVVNDDNPTYGTEGGENTNDKIFLLSIAEAQNSSYFADDNSRIATNTAYAKEQGAHTYSSTGAGDWWLRSPGYGDIDAALVDGDGCLYRLGFSVGNIDVCVRPAFNLNLNSVLFTSAAEGGKSASSMDSGLTAVDDYTGSEWKLTLLDETREFAVTETEVSGISGGTVTLNYTGATTGENEYISVIIADENGAQYYGRVAQPDSADGQVKIKIPDSLAAGEYTLNVFSEQYNGDYKTDYASAFAEVALTVEEAAAPGIDTGKAIQLVDSGTAANIGGGQADNIYFGTYQQSSAGSTEPDGTEGVDWIKSDTANKNGQGPYYYIDPVKWRVLENADGQLFLLSDQNLDVFQYHTDWESVTWEKSTMRSWLNGYGVSENIGGDSGTDYTSDHFIGTAFSEKEQKAIAETEVVNDDNPTHGTEGGNNTTDKIFLLSIAEANNGSYFANDSSRIATNTAYVAGGGKIGGYVNGVGKADNWWLRSPGYGGHGAADVGDDGGVSSDGGSVDSDSRAVRPAFNLDLNSVLFTSAAAGGKSANGMDSGLTAVGDYDGSEWKLTLLDEARNSFEISNATITDTITFSYSGAQTGTNEYISVIIEDNGAITHYGRILQLDGTTNSENGAASLTLPAGVALSDTTKLYVFNEQYNGDKMTDYASQLKEISSPTVDTTAPKLSDGSATRDSETAATVKFTSDEAGTYYYAVVESNEAAPTIDTTRMGTACASGENIISLTTLSGIGAKEIYIVVKDAVGNVSDKLKIAIPAIYTLTVNLNGGSGSTTGGEYPAGEAIHIDAGSRSNYRFNGWTSSNGGNFADASSASTTFTMPAADTTITANWTYSGGGGGYSDDDDEPDQPADPDDTGVSDLLNTEDHIQYLFGYPDGTFGPENNMTRAEVAQMFYNLLLDQDVEVTKTFDDVPANAWYTKAVNTLASLDIISGVGDNKFEPERSITRAEFTSMAMKFAVGGEEGKNIFSDVDENDWFYDAVVNSIQYGWIHGYGDGTFRPNNPITRAEVTAIVNNMLGRAADEDFVDEHAEELTQFSDIEKHWAYYHIAEATNDHDYTKPSSGENWTRLN